MDGAIGDSCFSSDGRVARKRDGGSVLGSSASGWGSSVVACHIAASRDRGDWAGDRGNRAIIEHIAYREGLGNGSRVMDIDLAGNQPAVSRTNGLGGGHGPGGGASNLTSKAGVAV